MANFSEYRIKKGDTLESLSEQLGIEDPQQLRRFHNNYCALEDLISDQPVVGQIFYLPSNVDVARLNDYTKYGS